MAGITCSPASLDCPPFPTALHALTPPALWGPLLWPGHFGQKCPHGALPLSPGGGARLHLRHLQPRQRAVPCHNHQGLFLLPDWECWPRTPRAHPTLPRYTWGPLVLRQAYCTGLISPLLTCLHVPRQLLCPNPTVFSKVVFISKNLQFRGML